MKIDEKIETLTELGLTLDEARVYLTLLNEGPLSANEIAKNSKIARPHIYSIAASLHNQGAVETSISKPTLFNAIPAKTFVISLLERKNSSQKMLCRKTIDLLSSLNTKPKPIRKEQLSGYTEIYGKKVIIQRFEELLNEAETGICTVTSKKWFSAAMITFAERYKGALNRNVNFKIAVEGHIPAKLALQVAQPLLKDSNFEIKFFDYPPPAIVSVIDSKIGVILSTSAHLAECSAITSSNPCFVEVVKTYFETTWYKGIDFVQYIKQNNDFQSQIDLLR